MNIAIIVFAIIGAVISVLFIYSKAATFIYSLKQKRKRKRRKESFDLVLRNINDCHYWLNGEERKPFLEMFLYMTEQMKEYQNVPGAGLRDKVDSIIKNNQP